MDSSIITPGSTSTSQFTAAVVPQRVAETKVDVTPQQVNTSKDTAELAKDPRKKEEIRLKAVVEAAKSIVYVVSDHRFTIYKQDGQFITRFTSLRDGTVTIAPEPDVLARVGTGKGVILTTSA